MGIQNSTKCIETLRNCFLPFAWAYHGDNFTLQQDNAPIHASREAYRWLKTMDIRYLKWPANSPDLNPIENLWGVLARAVCKNGRQFKKKEELRKRVFEAWASIKVEFLKKLARSMKNRCDEVLLEKGGKTRY